ncbi:MAG: magnesium transporter CorA family protein [Miltoncostaeaceae bacterium]
MANLPSFRRGQPIVEQPLGDAERAAPDVRRIEAHGITWLKLEAPTEAETAWLAEHYDFHPLDYEDVLSRRRQRPKIDEYDGYAFLVFYFPRFDKATGRLQGAEVDVFVAEDLLITLPKEPLKPLNAMWSRCENRAEDRDAFMQRGSGYLLYEIVDALYDYCFPILDKIGFKLDSIEDSIFDEGPDDLVRDISNVKQEIINYRKIIKPQRPTLRLMDRSIQRYAPQDMELYFDDIVDKNERIWDLLEGYKEVAEALEATNEAAISHRLNDIIKVLTMLSGVVLPLSLIAAFYGMNVQALPFADDGWFSVVFPLGIMLTLAAGMVFWFRRKGWL